MKKKLNKNISMRDNKPKHSGYTITIDPVGEMFAAKWDEVLETYIAKNGTQLKILK